MLGESMLGERLPFTHDRLRIIRDYPNTMYAHAFDASVQAGGYNSYQEMRRFGIPTLFIPNTDTGMDDQLARCQISEKEGWGVVNESLSVKNLQKDIEKLFKLPKKPQNTVANGAEEVAHLLF